MPRKYEGEPERPVTKGKIIPRWGIAKGNEENKKALAKRRKWMEEALGAGLGAGVGGAGVGGAGLKKAAKKKVIPKLPKHWRNKPFI